MKKLVCLLNFILCFELILLPMDQSLFQIHSAQASTCSQGQEWNANLGRCLTDVETAKVMQATASCDPKDVECYKKNAQGAFDKKVASGEAEKAKGNNKFMSTVGNAGAIAGSVMAVVNWMYGKGNTCTAVSHGMLIAGGVTTFVGEMFANSKHKKNLKSIEKDWNKIVNTNFDGADKDSKKAHASAAQAEAFEMLAKAEDSIADNSKTKSKIHMAAAAMYAAAGIAAGLELLAESSTMGSAKANNWCGPKGTDASSRSTDLLYASNEYENFKSIHENEDFNRYLDINAKRNYFQSNVVKDDFDSIFTVYSSVNKNNTSPSIDEFQETRKLILDEETQLTVKSVITTILVNINPLPADAHAFDLSTIKGFMDTSYARLGFSVVLGGWSLIMMKHTKSQEEASRNRAEVLRKMKAEFAGASSALNMCAPEDRSNTSKPECYCYTPEGQRNSSRGNSQICQKLWSGELASAKDYKNSDNAFSGCINSANQHDAACACKKSSKGCLTVSTKGLAGVSTGALSLISTGISPVNEIASGNFGQATASDKASLANAMRTMKAVDKMMDQEPIKSRIKNKDKFLSGIETAVQKATGPGNYSEGLANNFSGNAASAVASLEKELDKKAPTAINKASSPTTGASTAAKKSQGFSFDLGEGYDQEKINGQVAKVMDQEFDYAQNDINQSQTNLFELLSNRYQRSGMRRLFDEEGITTPEAASNTDINN